jgi:hypothetical protein
MRGLAAFGEEGLKDGGAVGGEDARGNFYVMVEARVGEDFEAGADGTALGIFGTVNEARDAGLDDGAGAHAARLDGDVKDRIGEAMVAEKTSGFAKYNHFRVGRGVIVTDGAIAGTDQNLMVVDEHGANGDFGGFGRGTGFRERFLHELNVCFHSVRGLLSSVVGTSSVCEAPHESAPAPNSESRRNQYST